MSNELQLVDESNISVESKAEINEDIDRIIELHKNNRQSINRLVFESVVAMTTADDAQAELSNKGWLKRRIGSITGSNARLQDKISANRAEAMYASQQTLQKLAEQNLMTFDLIAAVNNKLNASMLKVGEEFENIYKGLAKFFKSNRGELARIETRLEKVERNVSLLNWQNSIEYQEFDGVEYTELDDVSKIVCLVRDFYDITKGEWSNSDLLLLKTAMNTIEISPKTKVNYFEVLKGISYDEKLKEYMLNGNSIMQIDDPSYLLSLGCMKKIESLNNEEGYVVDTIVDYMENSGIEKDREVVCSDLTSKYLATQAFVDVNVDVECYDLVLDLLYNIKQAKEEKLLLVHGAESEMQEVGEPNETVSEVAAEVVDPVQVYMLGKQYYNGDGVEQDYAKAFEYYQKAAELGNGDGYAGLGDLYYNGQGLNRDYCKAIEMYMKSSDLGSCYGMNMLGCMYQKGEGVKQSNPKAFECFKQAAELGNVDAMNNLGHCYEDGKGIRKSSSKAFTWYEKAAGLGNCDAMNSMGRCYAYGIGTREDDSKAVIWFEKAVELGSLAAMKNMGILYESGVGVKKNYKEAMKLYKKALSLGDEDAPGLIDDLKKKIEKEKERKVAQEIYDTIMSW